MNNSAAQSAEIITIGEELLSGDSDMIDTNSIYLTKQLRNIGLRVLYKTTVGDNEQIITDVIKLALTRADVIITTGGLGPTVDDMTRQGVANSVGRKLEFHQELLDGIAAKFVNFKSRMSDNNRSQAMLPERAIVIDNPVGTAPSFIVEEGGKAIISLPGVPREMKFLMEQTVIGYLREKVGASGIIKNRVLRTAGIGESLVDEQVGDMEKLSNPVVGLAAHAGQTDIRIAARAATEAEADAMIAELETEIRKRLGSYIYGVDQDPLEHAFVEAAKKAGVQVALIEVGTDGFLRQRIESDPDGKALLLPARLSDEAMILEKTTAAKDSSVLKEVAEQAANAAFAEMGSGFAIAVISEDRGTAIAVTDGSEIRSRTYSYGGISAGGPEWATGWAMSMGWHILTSRTS